MPDVPGPETLRPELAIIRERAHELDERLRPVLTQDRPLDLRPCGDEDPFDASPRSPRRHIWVRAVGKLGDSLVEHQAILAYASDYGLLITSLRPHGMSFRDPRLMVASLDHSIWFHRPFRMDEWLLYQVDSPVSFGARGFARGTYFTRQGELVASVAQEGLIRVKRPPEER